MMRRSIVVTLVIVGLLLPNLAAAAGLELIVTLKSARKIGQVKSKYDLQVLEQIGPQPIFLVLSDSTDLSLIDRMMADRLVVDVEENAFVTLESRPQNDSDAVAGHDVVVPEHDVVVRGCPTHPFLRDRSGRAVRHTAGAGRCSRNGHP